MSIKLNIIDDCQREHREPREQADRSGLPDCSLLKNTSENTENISQIIDMDSTCPFDSALQRPSFTLHLKCADTAQCKSKRGLYYHSVRHDKQGNPHYLDDWICSPLIIIAVTQSPDNDNFGRLLKFMDSRGNWREWAMPMHLLKGSGDELLGELLNQGFIFDRKKRTHLIDFIMNERPKKDITAASQIGWHGDVFVLPNNVIGGSDIVFQSEYAAEHDFKIMGTIDDWNKHIGALCEGNIPLIVSVSTALAGSLLRWCLTAISSGEKTPECIMLEGGVKANTGQLVRLLSIPAAFEYGIFSELHEFSDGRQLADHLKSACQKHYGQLGPAFVQKLIEEKNGLSAQFEKVERMFIPLAKSNLEKRAASFFAVIALAGELAISYGLIAWQKDSVVNATLTAFKRWQQFQDGNHTEDSRILDAVSNFIIKHGDSRFSRHLDAIDDRAIINRAGWYKDSNGKRIYMFTPNALQEAGAGYDKNRIVAALSKHQWITEKDADRQTKRTRTPQGALYLYYVSLPEQEENQ